MSFKHTTNVLAVSLCMVGFASRLKLWRAYVIAYMFLRRASSLIVLSLDTDSVKLSKLCSVDLVYKLNVSCVR